jgi:hypothetical protein
MTALALPLIERSTDSTAPCCIRSDGTAPQDELEQKLAQTKHELLLAKARAGELALPTVITTKEQADVWLAWAKAHHHTPGCLCHRCPEARQLQTQRLSATGAVVVAESARPAVVAVSETQDVVSVSREATPHDSAASEPRGGG